MICSRRQESQNASSRYGLHFCKCKHNYKQTVHREYSILLGYDDVSLSNWIPEFDEMYCPHLQVSKCSRRILVEHFDTWRREQHVNPKGDDLITQLYNVLYQNNGISAPSQQKSQNSQLLGKSRVVIMSSIYMETAFSSYHLTLNYVHFIIFVQYLNSFTAL